MAEEEAAGRDFGENPLQIGMLLYPGFTLLDLAGPTGVFRPPCARNGVTRDLAVSIIRSKDRAHGDRLNGNELYVEGRGRGDLALVFLLEAPTELVRLVGQFARDLS